MSKGPAGRPQYQVCLGATRRHASETSKTRALRFMQTVQCPVCKDFSTQVAPDLISNVVRKGTAKYDFRQFTIIGPQSVDAAKAAYAAGEQGRYWNFVATVTTASRLKSSTAANS